MNSFDLHKQNKTKFKLTKGKINKYPRLLEAQYKLELQKLFKDNVSSVIKENLTKEVIENLVNKNQIDMKTDSFTDDLARIFKNINYQIEQKNLPSKTANIAKKYADKANTINKKQFNDSVLSVLGINPLLTEKWLIPLMDAHIDRNIDLITKMSNEYLDKVKFNIRENIQKGVSTSDISSQIQEDTGISERRSKLIARDQIGKFNGQMTMERHKEIGIKSYIWITALDERVRGNPGGLYPKAKYSHWDRHGKIFNYNDPPPDGHAGEPIQCRCIQQPNFEDFFKD